MREDPRYTTTLRVLKVAWLSKDGLNNSTLAKLLGVSTRTVKRDKSFLRRRGAQAIKVAA